jgi:hypothetical protein
MCGGKLVEDLGVGLFLPAPFFSVIPSGVEESLD